MLQDLSNYDFEGSLIGDKSNTVVFDNSKVKAAVPEFKAVIRTEEGIRRCVENVLAHPELQVSDEEFDAWCDKVIEKMEELKKNF